MKAAIVTAAGKGPVYGEFTEPIAQDGQEVITVSASALSPFSRSRSSGSHYSSDGVFPAVAGSDGVGRTADGRRVYFVLPEAPYGGMAERTLVDSRRLVAVPDGLDDITAAAIANPGMSAWAALVDRAHLLAGETVLINGATGTAGRIAVQLAKYLGAGKVIATGRNVEALEEVKGLGADVVIPFTLGVLHPFGAKEYEERLSAQFEEGIDIVIDYLWGVSAKTVILAIAKTVEDATPVRFVHVGEAGREANIELPGAALRSSAIVLMGSGVKSLSMSTLKDAIAHVFEVAGPAKLQIATKAVTLAEVETVWESTAGKPRVVFTID
jgi:NADPH:quinone reductase-like Zn-dependent oxidoreductase